MILVDTSVWINHMRASLPALNAQLEARNVLCHEMVIGELACGNLAARDTALRDLIALPVAATVRPKDLLQLIEGRRLMGRGIRYVDANLLGSTLAREGTTLWTHDKRLQDIAIELGIAHLEGEGV
ncbi:MAG: type II toxin-antitoxin system VapC family toxin [Gammaproteobacteria bacterium]|nr:type II toxin-antitoxin system VapC family toxin [Gammaproteobacteria bacterium]